jgi:hypothetical protein
VPLIAAAVLAEAERRRQEGRARPAYRDRWLGWRHMRLEHYARRLLVEARPGRWLRFYAADADDAATVDQCIRYIVRRERPAQSVRVEWLRRDGSWADRFPRLRDRRGRGDIARLGREVRAELARPQGRDGLQAAGWDARELRSMARERSADGEWWYAGRLRLGPKRGTVPPPESPRPRRSAADMLGDALRS